MQLRVGINNRLVRVGPMHHGLCTNAESVVTRVVDIVRRNDTFQWWTWRAEPSGHPATGVERNLAMTSLGPHGSAECNADPVSATQAGRGAIESLDRRVVPECSG